MPYFEHGCFYVACGREMVRLVSREAGLGHANSDNSVAFSSMTPGIEWNRSGLDVLMFLVYFKKMGHGMFQCVNDLGFKVFV